MAVSIVFLDLLVSDWIQALGFSLSFIHLGHSNIHNSQACLTQAVLLELGDVAGAFSTLLIASHTFLVLVIRHPPAIQHLFILIALKWLCCIFLTVVGPIFYNKSPLGPVCKGFLPFTLSFYFDEERR